MNAVARDVVRRLALSIPLDARQVLQHGRYLLLQRLARSCGISGFVADGEYGIVQGAVTDAVVFPVYAQRKTWAAEVISVFAEYLREGGTYIDIGANIGLTTISIARNPRVSCLAFEPDPTNFRLLCANIAANCPHGNITAYDLALLDRDTSLPLEMSPWNGGDRRARLTDESGEYGEYGESAWPAVEVRARRLDDLAPDPHGPLGAKIDTQGAEPFVLAGGQRTLGAAGLLAIEFWPYGMSRTGGDPQLVIDFLQTNFREGRVSVGGKEDGFDDWQPITATAERLEQLCRAGTGRALGYLDLLARK